MQHQLDDRRPAYQSISVDHHPEDDDHEAAGHHHHHTLSQNKQRLSTASCVAIAVLIFVTCDWARLRFLTTSDNQSSSSSVEQENSEFTNNIANTDDNGGLIGSHISTKTTLNDANLPPLPTGVNLASWLSLEDWFFVGTNGAVEVASPDDAVAASCLPPLHLDTSTGPRWNSETDLLSGLADHYQKQIDAEEVSSEGRSTLGGYPNDKLQSLGGYGKAIKAIHAFRSSYYDIERELSTMNELGIKYVRVPVSWCWTDYDPSLLITKNTTSEEDDGDDDSWIYMDDEEVKEKFTCKDPFYENVYWPAISRNFVTRFLRACAKYNIGATLDIHTYPGGTSIGTFSGVWPKYSKFWTEGDVPADYGDEPDIGRTLLKEFIVWLESLATDDPVAFKGLRALSPMNEPAHLAGLYNGKEPIRTDRETFLPPLPPNIAKEYLSQLNQGLESKPHLTQVPDGNHLRVFLWLHDAIDTFRQSKLPSLGKELHVNVHESVLPADVLPKEEVKSDYGLNTAPMHVFGAWWRASTTVDERSKWAVLDIHHYMAWGPQCSGAVEGSPTGRYACSDEVTKAQVLGNCSTWASVYRSTLEDECGEGLRLASAEFSGSTHHSVRHACNDLSTLTMMFESQVNEAKSADVELFYWAYKMPYGGAFRNAWSLKHLMYLMGVLSKPDEESFHCGDHIPPVGEPKDGSI